MVQSEVIRKPFYLKQKKCKSKIKNSFAKIFLNGKENLSGVISDEVSSNVIFYTAHLLYEKHLFLLASFYKLEDAVHKI